MSQVVMVLGLIDSLRTFKAIIVKSKKEAANWQSFFMLHNAPYPPLKNSVIVSTITAVFPQYATPPLKTEGIVSEFIDPDFDNVDVARYLPLNSVSLLVYLS